MFYFNMIVLTKYVNYIFIPLLSQASRRYLQLQIKGFINNVKSCLIFKHLISCFSWVGQSTNLRSKQKIKLNNFTVYCLC